MHLHTESSLYHGCRVPSGASSLSPAGDLAKAVRIIRHCRVVATQSCCDVLQGALLVRLVKADELPAKDGTTSDPFCTFKLGKHKEKKSFVMPATLQPVWNQKFEWLNVSGRLFGAGAVVVMSPLHHLIADAVV